MKSRGAREKPGTAAPSKSACRVVFIPITRAQTYLDILKAIKAEVPDLHVHAFSPLEIHQGAETSGIPIAEFLGQLIEAGLGSLPGTAAEILDDEVRALLCPDKIDTSQWFEVVDTAHRLGLKTTATIMFGHIDRPAQLGTPT